MPTPIATAGTGELLGLAAGLTLAISTPAVPTPIAAPLAVLPKSVPTWAQHHRPWPGDGQNAHIGQGSALTISSVPDKTLVPPV